jgi:EAL and modified HD-GYP domain-containing signal transduction protein
MFGFLRALFGSTSTPADPDLSLERPTELAPPRVKEPAAPPDRSFVCREPILDRGHRIAGYEFLLHQRLQKRLSGRGAVLWRAYDDVLIRNLASVGAGSLIGDRLSFMCISPESLENPRLSTLPAANTVLMIDAPDACGLDFESLPDRLSALKERGFRIGYHLQSETSAEAILPLCGFVLISTPAYDGLEIADLVRHLRKLKTVTPLSLIAADIESPDDFHLCFRAGFDYFQGPFVNHRENWHPPKANVDRALITHVLSQLRSNVDNAVLASTVRQDAVITYKLLRYINSPFNGLSHEITTIDQCLQLLGRERFYRWLSLLLFDVQKPGYVERILTEQALVRANLMERMGQRSHTAEANPDQLFLTGLFSLLDKLLDRSMAETLASVSVPQAVTDALISGRGPLRPFLNLVVACEKGVQEEIAACAAVCRLDVAGVNEDLLAALVWANEVSKMDGS